MHDDYLIILGYLIFFVIFINMLSHCLKQFLSYKAVFVLGDRSNVCVFFYEDDRLN